MTKRLSLNCEVTVFGGISCLWHYVSDTWERGEVEPLPYSKVKHPKITGYYVRKARREEAFHVPGGKLSDDFVIVHVPTRDFEDYRGYSQMDVVIVPRGCVERL